VIGSEGVSSRQAAASPISDLQTLPLLEGDHPVRLPPAVPPAAGQETPVSISISGDPGSTHALHPQRQADMTADGPPTGPLEPRNGGPRQTRFRPGESIAQIPGRRHRNRLRRRERR
jgi:hypothetical protein